MPLTPSLRHCSNKYKLAREGEKDKINTFFLYIYCIYIYMFFIHQFISECIHQYQMNHDIYKHKIIAYCFILVGPDWSSTFSVHYSFLVYLPTACPNQPSTSSHAALLLVRYLYNTVTLCYLESLMLFTGYQSYLSWVKSFILSNECWFCFQGYLF